MILDLDAGNSRIKWRLSVATGSAEQGLVVVEEPASAARSLVEALAATVSGRLQRIRVSSVRGEDFAGQLQSAAIRQWQVEPEFARVTSAAAGVRNAYEQPASMGVDRWLALLAAYHRAGGSCGVLDCGSAMTFDWADSAGQHRGGYIVPGLSLMRQSLASKTAALAVPATTWGETAPGTSTAAAISHGILVMAAGFAGRCHEQVLQQEPACRWYLTGGDAQVLAEQLPWAHDVVPDLVLDGLALVLP